MYWCNSTESIQFNSAALCAKSVLKIGPISTRTASIPLQSSRKIFYAYILPVGNLGTARFLRLSFVFTTKNKKEFRIATVAIFRYDLYAAVVPQIYTPTYCQSATFGPLAFCICPLFFMTKNQKQLRKATVAMFRSDLYAGAVPQMSPPLYGGGDINR